MEEKGRVCPTDERSRARRVLSVEGYEAVAIKEHRAKTRRKVFCGDASTIIEFKGALGADLTFMDPPYNIGVDYGDPPHLNDSRSRSDYLSDVNEWIKVAIGATRPGGVIAILISEEYANAYGSILDRFEGEGKIEKINRIIWRETFAQYTERWFTREHRHLFLYRISGNGERIWDTDSDDVRVPSARMLAGDKRAKGPRVPGDVWECPRLPGNAKARVDWHPCQLHPMPLRRIVAAFTRDGGKVNEMFCGSGSLAVVCADMNRNYIGIDANKEFVLRAKKRLEEQKAASEPEPIEEAEDGE